MNRQKRYRVFPPTKKTIKEYFTPILLGLRMKDKYLTKINVSFYTVCPRSLDSHFQIWSNYHDYFSSSFPLFACLDCSNGV